MICNKYKFSNHDIYKFLLLLGKSICLYEYKADQGKFNEPSLAEKEDFHNHLNMEDNTDPDYTHAKQFVMILK